MPVLFEAYESAYRLGVCTCLSLLGFGGTSLGSSSVGLWHLLATCKNGEALNVSSARAPRWRISLGDIFILTCIYSTVLTMELFRGYGLLAGCQENYMIGWEPPAFHLKKIDNNVLRWCIHANLLGTAWLYHHPGCGGFFFIRLPRDQGMINDGRMNCLLVVVS